MKDQIPFVERKDGVWGKKSKCEGPRQRSMWSWNNNDITLALSNGKWGQGKEQVNGCYGKWVPLHVVT